MVYSSAHLVDAFLDAWMAPVKNPEVAVSTRSKLLWYLRRPETSDRIYGRVLAREVKGMDMTTSSPERLLWGGPRYPAARAPALDRGIPPRQLTSTRLAPSRTTVPARTAVHVR